MATQYVNGATGSDANDGLTEGTAKATIGAAITASVNGDFIYIKASATYSEQIVIPNNTGRRLVGYGTVITDRTRFILDGNNTLAVGWYYRNTTGATSTNNGLLNAEIKNFTSHGWHYDHDGGDGNNTPFWENIWSHHNGGHGFHADGSSARMDRYALCVANDNTLDGFSGIKHATRCVSHNNGGVGFQPMASGSQSAAQHCLSYNNGGVGFNNVSCVSNCTSYGNTGSGFTFSRQGLAMYCIAMNNGAWGFDSGVNVKSGAGNISYNNTSGANTGADMTGGGAFEFVTTNPGFTNAAGEVFEVTDTSVQSALAEGEVVRLTNCFAGYHSPVPGGGGGTRGYWG